MRGEGQCLEKMEKRNRDEKETNRREPQNPPRSLAGKTRRNPE